MAVTTTNNKPLNPRGNDQSPKGYNRAELYSGKALDFDGANDSIEINSFSMSGQNVSFAFYLKADNWVASDLIFDFKTRRLALGCQNTNVLSLYSNNAWHDFGTISDTTNRNFITITIEGTTAKAYINAQPFGTIGTIATIDLTSPAEARLMGRYSDTAQYFDGQLSGFKIFNTALTAAQVADLYNNPEKVVPTGVDNTALKLWLPMQEGAGTTAYDGSGNGNHGTISGATWTHGIGAPVSQTAVIDWNKGQNLFTYSEDFSQTAWTKDSVTLTADDTTAPDGSDTAEKVEASASNAYIQQTKSGLDTSASYTLSVWAKTDSGTADFQIGNVDVSNYVTKTASTEWQRFEVTQTPSAATRYPRIFRTSTSDAVTIYLWGAQLEKVSSAGAYIPNHTATPITSDVLLPQGLTTGRDITGVNLFENVRKQGALNLDGNSWAEVHDNASLDITSAITLEAWVYWDNSSDKGLLGKWEGTNNQKAYLLYQNNNQFRMYISSDGSAADFQGSTGSPSIGWNHLVGTYDGANIKLYLNGAFDSSKANASGLNATNLNLEIGRHETQTSSQLNAPIAQPRIYNRALTAEEVQRNYNAGKNIYK